MFHKYHFIDMVSLNFDNLSCRVRASFHDRRQLGELRNSPVSKSLLILQEVLFVVHVLLVFIIPKESPSIRFLVYQKQTPSLFEDRRERSSRVVPRVAVFVDVKA